MLQTDDQPDETLDLLTELRDTYPGVTFNPPTQVGDDAWSASWERDGTPERIQADTTTGFLFCLSWAFPVMTDA